LYSEWIAHTLALRTSSTSFAEFRTIVQQYLETNYPSLLSCKDEEIQVAPNGAGYRRAL